MPGKKQGLISRKACTLRRINSMNVCENRRHRIVPLACVSSFKVKLPGKELAGAIMHEHRLGTVYVMPE